ncbi:response regulator [Natrinema salifodinae]|uniref:CheY chemotaxis protein or a CheY-like REC (Receiver) domain n=1 Tax=Natrinema salifodinae TaxID=1202768 RepID=A0A1I0QVM2_9EURY|nr:response regulator [Natrinema salifodinae]SEW31510.1 CheY chemotaxis protein or a CheY-like REC (receiver) domain [Natrinema salifodinae]
MDSTQTQTKTGQRTGNSSLDILLVEDNPGDIRLTREALTEADLEYSLDVFTNGENVLHYLSENVPQPYPDLVFLDLDLPGKDGDEILETMRDDSQLRNLPVIVLTSSESREDIRRCYEATANAYVTKPTDHDRFITIMESIAQFWVEQAELPPDP